MMVVLKAQSPNLRLNQKSQQDKISQLLQAHAKRAQLHLKELHCKGSSIQFIIYLPRRSSFKKFIRSVTGALALKLSGASKKNALKKRFWVCRPWTGIVTEQWPLHHNGQKDSIRYLKDILMIEHRFRSLVEVALGP